MQAIIFEDKNKNNQLNQLVIFNISHYEELIHQPQCNAA
jgi:hypothetical protein